MSLFRFFFGGEGGETKAASHEVVFGFDCLFGVFHLKQSKQGEKERWDIRAQKKENLQGKQRADSWFFQAGEGMSHESFFMGKK